MLLPSACQGLKRENEKQCMQSVNGAAHQRVKTVRLGIKALHALVAGQPFSRDDSTTDDPQTSSPHFPILQYRSSVKCGSNMEESARP